VCETIFAVPGVLETSTCGECSDDFDCPADAPLCAPTYDLALLGGFHSCVPPLSIPDAGGCDLEGSGELQCASGTCAPAAIMGIPVLGVCSPCDEDLDCDEGLCVLPELVVEGNAVALQPGFCL
jgi:hypothetical protein